MVMEPELLTALIPAKKTNGDPPCVPSILRRIPFREDRHVVETPVNAVLPGCTPTLPAAYSTLPSSPGPAGQKTPKKVVPDPVVFTWRTMEPAGQACAAAA